MLRCACRRGSRLVVNRVTGRSSVAAASGSGSAALPQSLQEQDLWRPVFSCIAPRRALSSAKDDGSGSFGIATGLELEELEAKRKGANRFEVDAPRGPFGTKEHPAIIESVFNERIVGCSGGVGDDEHDVTWFHLKKGEDFECPVCAQVFELKTIGDGGSPGGHH